MYQFLFVLLRSLGSGIPLLLDLLLDLSSQVVQNISNCCC